MKRTSDGMKFCCDFSDEKTNPMVEKFNTMNIQS